MLNSFLVCEGYPISTKRGKHMYREIKKELEKAKEEKYQQFTSKLLPGTKNILGVRLPYLRKMAKRIAKENKKTYWKEAKEDTFEEIMLQGMVIGYWQGDMQEIFTLADSFIPKIDNWSVCDSFCSGLKIAKQYPEQVWEWLQPYLYSDQEYKIRFALVMLLDYYINSKYVPAIFSMIDPIKKEDYYVKMAVAWLLSMCYVSFPKETWNYLENSKLDAFTYDKTLQKIIESNTVAKEVKQEIRERRKQNKKQKIIKNI